MLDTDPTNEQKEILEKVYKQNLELAIRNKTLSLLRQLYQISLLVLEPSALAREVLKTVREIFEFELVGVLIFNQQGDTLVPLKFDLSKRLAETESSLNEFLEKSVITFPDKNAFAGKIMTRNETNHTENISDLWGGSISGEHIKTITEKANIKTLSGYPLLIGKKPVGLLVFCLNRSYEQLSQFEQDSIASLVDVIAVALDRAWLYQKLEATNQDLKVANDGKTNLIYVMNHQIKGYLGKDRDIYAELLTGDYGTIPDAAKPLIQTGFDSSSEGVGVIVDILRGSAVESGKIMYDRKPVDIKNMVSEVSEKEKERAIKKGLAFELVIADGDYQTIGDNTHLSEAFRNLIDNSIRYTPTGSIHVSLARTADKITFIIKDTGVGISDEDKLKLFMAGGHGKDSAKINVDSSGFGLAFVKDAIEAHKGTVRAESEGTGKGSTFTIELPVKA